MEITSVLGGLWKLQSLAGACVLSAFFALAIRASVLAVADRGRPVPVIALRVLASGVFASLGIVYALFAAPLLAWTERTIGAAVITTLVILVSVVVRRLRGRERRSPRIASVLVHLVLLLSLLLLAAVTLMTAGFFALTEDRPVLLVDVTGETETQRVRWAAPDRPPSDEVLTTHRVVFRTPQGVPVAEAWLYGDQVAVKGRVLRLSPILNAAGISNLYELQFAHNGYVTAERHAQYPHVAVPLHPSGPLAVHRWWRSLQGWLLERWEAGTSDGSDWVIRSSTTESTYFPLVDAEGRPIRGTYRLVLTPGGLSSS